MQTSPVTSADLARSVIAVPPLARNDDLTLSHAENAKLIQHLEQGGIRTMLFGGNANLYHIAVSEYREFLTLISTASADETLIVPSVGPAYGTMMDQAEILREFNFPTAMVLPMQGQTTQRGFETGFREFVLAFGKPAVLYLKYPNALPPGTIERLFSDGCISWIKYAMVRDDPSNDEYLRELTESVDPSIVVSGIGEQPAIVHLKQFGLNGFTSGCVCIAPALSQQMLIALKSDDLVRADSIRQMFRPLEDLRNQISPIRVLHDAVSLAGIAQTGPMLPLLDNLNEADSRRVGQAAQALMEAAVAKRQT